MNNNNKSLKPNIDPTWILGQMQTFFFYKNSNKSDTSFMLVYSPDSKGSS